MDLITVEKIEGIIGYKFNNTKLLEKAFTHSTYANENLTESNEKLEFLGDSILNFIVTKKLYIDSGLSVGDMTNRRKDIVSKKPLSDAVTRLGLIEFLRVGNGVDKDSFKEKAISNLIEAIIGAVYMDSNNLNECASFVARSINANINTNNIGNFSAMAGDYKSILKEWQEKTRTNMVVKESIVKASGKESYRCTIEIMGQSFVGEGDKKIDAHQEASKKAFMYINPTM